jgi:hypothetical protein
MVKIVMKSWKDHAALIDDSSGKKDVVIDAMHKRIANYSWRMLSMQHIRRSENSAPLSLTDRINGEPQNKMVVEESNAAQAEAHAASASRDDYTSLSTVPLPESYSKMKQSALRNASRSRGPNSPSISSTSPFYTDPLLQSFPVNNLVLPKLPNRATLVEDKAEVGKGVCSLEYSDHGTGDFRSPSFLVTDNSNGSTISPLRYRRHVILRNKPPMPDGMPHVRSRAPAVPGKDHIDASTTLIVTMQDIVTGLEVDLW